MISRDDAHPKHRQKALHLRNHQENYSSIHVFNNAHVLDPISSKIAQTVY